MESKVAVTCSVVTAATLVVFWWYYKNKKEKIPTKWKAVGTVSDLHLYPLKSGYRVELSEGECTKYGLKQLSDKPLFKLRDRVLIVYTEEHHEFRTARTHPKMVLIEVSSHDSDHISLDAPNMRTLYVKIPVPNGKNVTTCTMHQKEVAELVDCGDEAASWLSRYILNKESGLRLGYHDEKLTDRFIKKSFLKFYPKIRDDDMGIYSDLSSYMLMTQVSVEDLNKHLDKDVTCRQFRPTITVKNVDLPYVEEKWNWIKIGEETIFQNIKPCTRCVFTTIDSETGIFDPKREPLTTLKKYRQLENEEERKFNKDSPVMGINLGLRKAGVIKVDDTVYINVE